MRIFITGASGLIGGKLLEEGIQQGHHFVAITRNQNRFLRGISKGLPTDRIQVVEADATQPGPWQQHLQGCDWVFSLAGEPVAGKRWNDDVKHRIESSRVESVRRIVDTIVKMPADQRPKRLLSASAVGYYGDCGDRVVTETDPPGAGFLSQVCSRWENAAFEAQEFGVQVSALRMGVVLAREGGALKTLLPAFRLFLGGRVGTGKQYVPWIHLDDVVNAFYFCAALAPTVSTGPINLVAPQPVPMKDFVKILGETLRRPSALPVPSPLLKLLFGEGSEVLLHGQRAVPSRLLALGYSFAFPALRDALSNLLK